MNEGSRITFRLPEKDKLAIQNAAIAQGESVSTIVRMVLRNYISELTMVRGLGTRMLSRSTSDDPEVDGR